MAKKQREPWFAVGRPLSPGRSRILLIASFCFPIALWCLAAYAPIWDYELKITLTSDAESEDFPTVYLVGDSMENARFGAFQEAVRSDNAAILEAEPSPDSSGASIRRANKRILRGIYPVAAEKGWMKEGQDKNYAALYNVWKGIAEGNMRGGLSSENVEIVTANWEKLSAISPVYDSSNFYSQPLQKLVPQGVRDVKRPVYLPAPHTVVARAAEDFSGNSKLGDLQIWSRYATSLKTVALGFLISCAIGIPIALLCGTFSFFSRIVEPFVDFFRYMPAPAFGTLLMAVFGIYGAPKIALVVVGTLPQLILMAANTTRMLDSSLLDAAQTLGADRRRLVTKVVIPGILPHLYNDLRILLGWAWTWLVVAELIGVKAGLTEFIDTQGRRFHFDHVYPVILLIGLTGFLSDQFLSWFRGVIFPYTEEGAKAGARVVGRCLSKFAIWKRRPANSVAGVATTPGKDPAIP
ncbi:MAG: ABC transporter permease [Verrucomicrobiota bacterium]